MMQSFTNHKATKTIYGVVAAATFAFALGACDDQPTSPRYHGSESASLGIRSQVTVFTAAGDITSSVDAFRVALGTLNPNLPGSATEGRREINWDAVPPAFTNTNDFPGNFFNQPVAGRARGVEFFTPGSGFRTSDNNFTDLNLDFQGQFNFFSPVRTFAAVGSNVMTVTFFVPGSQLPATSTGFGVVFSDVDRSHSATIRLFDTEGKNLGVYAAPRSPSGVSFVAAMFPAAVVARVEIISGQAAVEGSAVDVDDLDGAPARDLVIMDDFIFGEPTPSDGIDTSSVGE